MGPQAVAVGPARKLIQAEPVDLDSETFIDQGEHGDVPSDSERTSSTALAATHGRIAVQLPRRLVAPAQRPPADANRLGRDGSRRDVIVMNDEFAHALLGAQYALGARAAGRATRTSPIANLPRRPPACTCRRAH